MGEKLDNVSKVLAVTTRFFEIMRFHPERVDILIFFQKLLIFYQQDIKIWNFEHFKSLFLNNNPFPDKDDYDLDIQVCFIHKTPIDNLEMISNYHPVFVELIKHAELLAEYGEIKQLKDFIDTIHCLADALWQKDVWHSRDFWNHRIKKYCKRWNVQFPGMRKYFFRFLIFNRRSF